MKKEHLSLKNEFKQKLQHFVKELKEYISTDDDQWKIKGFIDIFKNIYTISGDTKILSKLLEIHLFPKIAKFADENSYKIVLADHQNYYPDISFVSNSDDAIKFALDFKTTYRLTKYPGFCNGVTLGSPGEYFINRSSTKNIQFPYKDYLGHFCLGIIYTRTASEDIDEIRICDIKSLTAITSVIKDFQFFICEKWEIASDQRGSGNTANIGSINKIEDIIICGGMFKNLGEKWFDDYWMNYGKIIIKGTDGKEQKIKSLKDYLIYRGKDPKLVNQRASKKIKENE